MRRAESARGGNDCEFAALKHSFGVLSEGPRVVGSSE
jgi:hypothetical protein